MKKKKSIWRKTQIFFRATRRLLNIHSSSDPTGTIEDICANIVIKGYNIWILVCSALLASIGLDTNSTAVIIGAMLISPLMSPILGVGLGLGINDWDVFVLSLRNLGIATISSLLASVVYFNITPLGEPTSEILARTEPTLLDVGVALFGGIAGIVSGSRREKTNAIPGVAIATALMPPLCAAGYGLANLNFSIFLGAFYLFFINAVFISISTFLIVRYLRFPMHREPDEKTRRTMHRVMLISLIIVISPSVYFLYTVINRIRTVQQINTLIDEVKEVITRDNRHEVLNVERPRTNEELKNMKHIKIYVSGNPIDSALMRYYDERFREIGDFDFSVSRISNYSSEEIRQFTAENTRENILKLETRLTELQSQLDTALVRLREVNIKRGQRIMAVQLLRELQVFYTNLDTLEIYDYRLPKGQRGGLEKESSRSLTELISESMNFSGLKGLEVSLVWEVVNQDMYPFMGVRLKVFEPLERQWQEMMENLMVLKGNPKFPYLTFVSEPVLDNVLPYFDISKNTRFPFLNFALRDSVIAAQKRSLADTSGIQSQKNKPTLNPILPTKPNLSRNSRPPGVAGTLYAQR
ncbi:MAG: DUF389 domain-containing protein [Microscillaceae bacterium]|nr:DUF389 domain-containing protein [Microscillaceae bacterium]